MDAAAERSLALYGDSAGAGYRLPTFPQRLRAASALETPSFRPPSAPGMPPHRPAAAPGPETARRRLAAEPPEPGAKGRLIDLYV